MIKPRSVRAAMVLLSCALVGSLSAVCAQGGPADTPNAPGADTTTGTGNALRSTLSPQSLPSEEMVLKSSFIARQLAKSEWFDKAAAANPRLVAAVCVHPWAAAIIAKHKHIAEIAEADHYLCRRLTQHYWATECLLRNPHADTVIELDPQGIYYAMDKRPSLARLLVGNVMYYQMVDHNPDLGNAVIAHMK